MRKTSLRMLMEERKKVLYEFSKSILEKSYEEAKLAQEKIELLDDAIARDKHDKKYFFLIVPILIVITCLGLVGFSFMRRTAHVNFKGEFVVDALVCNL